MTWRATQEIHSLVHYSFQKYELICIYNLSLSLSLSATVFNNANQQINVYGDDVEVDYRGYEVTFLSSDWSNPGTHSL